jgi:solute carrier family 25 (mitochondrial phosphate transporter), member 23/24/25/41
LKSFFKGNGVNCIKIAPETATKFFFFDFLKNSFCDDPSNITMVERFLSGGVAGIIG